MDRQLQNFGFNFLRQLIFGCIVVLFFVPMVFVEVGTAQEEYRLGPGDIINIDVWGEPKLSGKYKVSSRGTIQKEWLPEVKVDGMPPNVAGEAFTEVLKKYMKSPKVRVDIVELRSRRVTLVGGVSKPGEYNLKEKVNLLSVLLEAGGIVQDASGKAIIIRGSDDDEKINKIQVDVDSLLNRGDLSQDRDLSTGDVVYVPFRTQDPSGNVSEGKSVIVTGAVKKMGAFPYRDGYTALNAIIDAGGFTKFAAPNRARVVRGKGKEEKVIRVDLGAVVNKGDKTKNVTLQPGDILVVPESLF